MIGRKEEKFILREAFLSKQSELIAVYGRRGVGKTFLIREHYADKIVYSMSGLFEASSYHVSVAKWFFNCRLCRFIFYLVFWLEL